MKALKGRNIVAVTKAKNDEVHNWTRTNDQYIVNDRARNFFRKAVIDMFGGESKIPESVMNAMLMDDYDKGKSRNGRKSPREHAEREREPRNPPSLGNEVRQFATLQSGRQ